MAGPAGVAEYLAAFAASGLATLVGALTIASAITFSGGAPQFEKLPEMLQFGTLVAVANTSVALLAVILLWSNPGALWLLLLPVGTLFLAYRAWVSEREKHERLELVYQSSRILQHSPELDVALLALLDHARAMFRAEIAEVVLETGGEDGGAIRTTSLDGGASEAIVPIPGAVREAGAPPRCWRPDAPASSGSSARRAAARCRSARRWSRRSSASPASSACSPWRID